MTRSHIPAEATLLIVSDVDGTLIDHGGRLPLPVWRMRQWIAHHLAVREAPTVFTLASSRTLTELVLLQRLLAIKGPLIAEDGGVLAIDAFLPVHATDNDSGPEHARDDTFTIERIGIDARELRARLQTIEEVQPQPILADMDGEKLRQLGFGTPGRVRRAITSREASVLLDLDPLDSVQFASYVDRARHLGVQVKRGGRWCTAVSGADKGRALLRLREIIRERFDRPLYVVAIGNEENDVALLGQADLPLVIRNPGRGHHPALLEVSGARPLDDEGPAGFLEMFRIIDVQSEVVAS